MTLKVNTSIYPEEIINSVLADFEREGFLIKLNKQTKGFFELTINQNQTEEYENFIGEFFNYLLIATVNAQSEKSF